MNALFQQNRGWIGADGCAFGDPDAQRRLWLFSDTWVARCATANALMLTIVNNSVALQDGSATRPKCGL